jgi:hypothetical protein
MAALSPEERKELARKAANARWAIAKNVNRARKKKKKRV